MSKRFPLQAVLIVRQQKEDAEERALGAIHAEIAQARATLTQLERGMAQQSANRANERNQVLSAAHFQAIAARWELLRQQQGELRKQLNQLETRRLQQQERFLAARRDRDMVTQLREKHEKAWQTAQQRQETKRLDDLFAARRAQPNRAESLT